MAERIKMVKNHLFLVEKFASNYLLAGFSASNRQFFLIFLLVPTRAKFSYIRILRILCSVNLN